MGSPAPTTKREGTGNMSRSYDQNLGTFMQALARELGSFEEALVKSGQRVAPTENQFELDMLRQFMPQFIDEGLRLDQRLAQGRMGADTQLLQDSGGYIDALRLADDRLNPEMARLRDASMPVFTQALQDFGPVGGLSPTQRAEIERSLARDNAESGVMSPTRQSTVESAMSFGSADDANRSNKIGQLNMLIDGALKAGTTFANPLRSFQLTEGAKAPTSTQTGFVGATKPLTGMGVGQQVLGETGQNIRHIQGLNANRTSTLQGIGNFGVAATSAVTGGQGCCFIFLEALNGPLPPYVRKCRDRYGMAMPECVAGYRKLSTWLVPMMRKFGFVKRLINFSMVMPIMKYGRFVVYREKEGRKYKPIFRAWMSIWKALN
jgi:hypothetical protein